MNSIRKRTVPEVICQALLSGTLGIVYMAAFDAMAPCDNMGVGIVTAVFSGILGAITVHAVLEVLK